ncbi:hypothetical protein Cgig2_006457 [Carnegiea gigantea]|uniref:Uncharacterized protein n=1 Tax=Carnegiea gigantea TaxID=171969 RepID=A0A9Q1Q660_9CARY|nr:hypothetical protein Cgig2_006457 [Carnegiea gigantea]
MEMEANGDKATQQTPTTVTQPLRTSFRDMLAKNNPNMTFSSYSNPVWNVADEDYYTSDDDELDPNWDEDPRCPTIHLTKEQKHYFVAVFREYNMKVGHREESCPTYPMKENHDPIKREKAIRNDPTAAIPIHRPECMEEFGPWMLVKKLTRKRNTKNNNGGAWERTTEAHNPSGSRPT